MGDGAREISNAGEQVFGDEGVRLMCWPHTYRNLVKKMATLRKDDSKQQKELMEDIQILQWSSHSEETFNCAFDLLETKYIQDTSSAAMKEFFEYFRIQMGPGSHCFQWYEGPNIFIAPFSTIAPMISKIDFEIR